LPNIEPIENALSI